MNGYAGLWIGLGLFLGLAVHGADTPSGQTLERIACIEARGEMVGEWYAQDHCKLKPITRD